MRSIDINTAVLAIITNQEDVEFIKSTGLGEWTEEEVKTMLGTHTYNLLFAENGHPVAAVHITDPDEDDGLVTIDVSNDVSNQPKEGNTMSNETTDAYNNPPPPITTEEQAMELKTRINEYNSRKWTKAELAIALVGAEDRISVLQARLAQQDNRIVELEMQELANEIGDTREHILQPTNHTLVRQELKKALWDAFSKGQREWLAVEVNGEKRGSQLTFEEVEAGRYKIRFGNLPTGSKATISKVLSGLAQARNWYCKVHSSRTGVQHVYINMLLK